MPKNIFKKSIFTLLLGIILCLNSLPLVALAQTPSGGTGSTGGTTPPAPTGGANVTENQLFYQFNYAAPPGSDTTTGTKIGAVNALPNATWQKTLSSLVTILLNISGALTLLALTVGGVFMITAHGSTDMLDKGKKIILYSIAGLIVIAVSYAIVIGVSSLQFFTPGTPGTTTGGGAPTTTPPPAGPTL